jgi:hypothetical protein
MLPDIAKITGAAQSNRHEGSFATVRVVAQLPAPGPREGCLAMLRAVRGGRGLETFFHIRRCSP